MTDFLHWEDQLGLCWILQKPMLKCKKEKILQLLTYVLTCELEAPSRQCQELVELPVEHLLGDQPRIGQGDANLHALQT